jgi:hypothetical protein
MAAVFSSAVAQIAHSRHITPRALVAGAPRNQHNFVKPRRRTKMARRVVFGGTKMRLVSLALLTALLAFGQPALAEQAIVTGVVIDWFGNYTSVEKAIEDSDISSGKRYRGSNVVPPKTNSDEIKLNSKTTFGIGFTLTGTPPNADVTLRQVYKYPSPGMPTGTAGQFKPSDEVTSAYKFGGGSTVGYNIGSDPSDWPTGTWTIQLWSGRKLLVEKNFTVSQP